MTKSLKFAFAATLGVLMIAGMPTAAFAQDLGNTNISSLDFEQTDVREALRALFKNVGVSYTLAPEVQGAITVSLKNVPFETALQNITRQVDATYRIEGGVYQIVRREDPQTPVSTNPADLPQVGPNQVRRRIKIHVADPQFIAILMGQKGGSQSFGLAPEISTIQNTPQTTNGGLGGLGGGIGGNGLGGGSGFGGSGLGGNTGFGGSTGGGLGNGGFGSGLGSGGAFGR